jgi:hypothetical protein
MNLCCQSDDRRDAVRRLTGWNGIDYVEVLPDQRTLQVYFLGKLPPELAADAPDLVSYLALEGGERITDIRIIDADPVVNPDPELDDFLVVRLDKPGDFSQYTLRLAGVQNVDPHYDRVSFSFKIDCPSDLDCAPVCECQPEALPQPGMNYLAKDYSSFRQAILDRMALLVPGWTERHAPDLGIALVELLAYEGDYLSYYQDAVATEAYLDTARQRISVRRHARLVDYLLQEGCNSRAFIAAEVDTGCVLDPAKVNFVTGLNNALADKRIVLEWDDLRETPASAYEVFEPFDRDAPIVWHPAHNEIRFHTWGRKQCCLERGATGAALIDTGLHLAPGDYLIFEEVIGPVTGVAADADPSHRHVVRLTGVTPGQDPVVLAQGQPTPYLAVEWGEEDALPFPLCISAIGRAPECVLIENISVARGNVVLTDHGRTWDPENLGEVPATSAESECICVGRAGDIRTIPGRYYPALARTPLTFSAPLPAGSPAAKTASHDPRAALPQIRLWSRTSIQWSARQDLLASTASDTHFVVEIDNGGVAHLRFGDGVLGAQPPAGIRFHAVYRTGNGSQGNVGAEAISRLVLKDTALSGVGIRIRNPLAASGGIDPEPMAEAKLMAPHWFRKCLERAIIASDYEEIAERNPGVQQASAELVWTGSWYEADVAVDPYSSAAALPDLLGTLAVYLENYRRMGHDLHLERAVYVPVHLELEVCALPGYDRAHVLAALLDAFSNRSLRGGSKGFFHPDNLTFGVGIRVSTIVAEAMAVPGVECVRVRTLQRLFEQPNKEIENGILPLALNEIAQLENDPNYPEHGKLVIDVHGGR